MRKFRDSTMDWGFDIFNSLNEFIEYTDNTPRSKAFVSHHANGSRDSGKSFTKTESWEEASHLLKAGYPEGMKAMLECKGGINLDATPTVSSDRYDVIGYRPSVPRAIQGVPRSMVRRHREQPKQNTLHIVYDCGASASVTSDTLALAGKNLMALIKYYEQHNTRVKVDIISGATKRDGDKRRTGMVIIPIKDYTQPVSPMLMSYCITHPSFFRRHCFAWIERSEYTNYVCFTNSYGNPISIFGDTIEIVLRENRIVGNDGHYLNCEKVAECQTIDDINILLNK